MSEIASQTLYIVNKELNATLHEARVALENFAEHPGNIDPLVNCAELLHQSHGVLRVVEVYGAALLAEEMEQVTRYLIASAADGRNQSEGLDALMRAMVQLPAYLERVLGGGRDLALVLLPLLNDLRAVRGNSLLSEGTLLLLNLKSDQQAAPQPLGSGEPPMAVEQWARRLRTRFQAGLLGWIRGERAKQNLEILARVAEKLEQVATTQPVFQLWWVTGAVIEALREEGLGESATVKRLLGLADREIKRLYELGEVRYSENPSLDLLNNLLFYVARAASNGPRVTAVRASFKLGELLPVDNSIEQARENLSAPSVKLMHTVGAAIKEDLTKVKDVLDIFVRKGATQVQDLAPQLELLKKISDTLGVLGLGNLRTKIQNEIQQLQTLLAQGGRLPGDALVQIAATLINVEDSLDSQLVKLITPADTPPEGEAAGPETEDDTDYRLVTEAVLRECMVNFARIKETITQVLQRPGDSAALDTVPQLLRGITAGLLMLGKSRAVELVEQTSRYLQNMLQPQERLSAPRLDRLADAIVSIEYYMETVQSGRSDPWYMLDNAERCLHVLGELEADELSKRLESSQQGSQHDLSAYAHTVALDRPDSLETLVATGTLPAAALNRRDDVHASTMPAIHAAVSAPATPIDEPDPEFIALFIEEAREEIASIERQFPLWEQNPVDSEALINIRRSFHTLKGSGRMVGARLIGEFAWCVEDLLNRIISKTVVRAPGMLMALRDAVGALPLLVQQLETGGAPPANAESIMSRLRGLTESREAGSPPSPSQQGQQTAPEEQTEIRSSVLDEQPPAMAAADTPGPTAPAQPAMDPVLHDIFTRESAGHLAALRDFLKRCEGLVPPVEITEVVYRACHTLSGSSKMAEARHGIRIAEPLHRYMRKLYENQAGLSREGLEVLERAVTAIEDVLANINESTGYFVQHTALIERIGELDIDLDAELAIRERQHAAAAMQPPAVHVQTNEAAVEPQPEQPPEQRTEQRTEQPPEQSLEPSIETASVSLDESSLDQFLVPSAQPAQSNESMSEPSAVEPEMEEIFAAADLDFILPSEVSAPAPPSEPAADSEALAGDAEEFLLFDASDAALTDEGTELRAALSQDLAAELMLPEEQETVSAEPAPAPAEDTEWAPQTPAQISADAQFDEDFSQIFAAEPAAEMASEAPVVQAAPEYKPELVAEPAPVPSAGPQVHAEGNSDVMEEDVSADFDPEIAGIFCEEATELLESAEQALSAWQEMRNDPQHPTELKRYLHTLKGGARMAGIKAMGDLSHELETLMVQIDYGMLPADDTTYDLLQASLDELSHMRDTVSAGRGVAPARNLLERVRRLLGARTAEEPLAETPVVAEPVSVSPPEPTAIAASAEDSFAADIFQAPPQAAAAEPDPLSAFGFTDEVVSQPSVEAAQPAEPQTFDLPESMFADAGEQTVGDAAPADVPIAPVAELESSHSIAPFRSLAPAPMLQSAESFESPAVEPMLQAPMEAFAPRPPERLPETFAEQAAEENSESSAAISSVAAIALPPGREPQQIAERQELARVDAELLDTLLNNAGEVSIFRARMEQQVNSIDFNLAELTRTVTRLKEQLRNLEIETEAQIIHRHEKDSPYRDDFDPLEMDRYSSIQQFSRALAESVSDVASIQNLLDTLTREAQNLLSQQARVVTEMQNGLMRTRMVPFQRHVQRLSRLVRQTASEYGKQAEMVASGASGELDRQVLERMLSPFEHMMRNAVVHGIETPEERREKGKPAMGRISVSLQREGSEVVFIVQDDGAGMNIKAIRDKAISMGLIDPRRTLTDEETMQLVLEPGFSTAGKITQAAGRGVGMDVVANEVKKLGGALFIDSTLGAGTKFTIRLPFTLAISQALIVRAVDELYALPLPTVEGVVRLMRDEVVAHLQEDTPTFDYGGQKYRFQHLGAFLGSGPSALPEQNVSMSVVLVRAGEHSTALVSDELVGSREIVVKSVGPQISGIRGISGATILGDGRIVIILDMGALVRSEWRSKPQLDAREREDKRTFALVVDDSITVRRVTQRLLERNGMRVMTARDGVDALSVLQDHVPDVILLDIEMPRMDGYEVASRVRNDERLQDIPIVMITSRVGDKHRARAIELGVDDYLGKPYQEAQLLDAIEPLVQRRRSGAAMRH